MEKLNVAIPEALKIGKMGSFRLNKYLSQYTMFNEQPDPLALFREPQPSKIMAGLWTTAFGRTITDTNTDVPHVISKWNLFQVSTSH